MAIKLKDMKERDFTYGKHVEALLEHIKKYWYIRAVPKGYMEFCKNYTDYKGQGEDKTALYDEFKGFGDGSVGSFGFPTRVSMPHVAYDDMCQGRKPIYILIGAIMAYGIAYGRRYEEVAENSTMNYRMRFASYAMEDMIHYRYHTGIGGAARCLNQEKADLKEREWKDYINPKIDMHVTMDKYRDLSYKLAKKRILLQLKLCFGSHKTFYKKLRNNGRIVIIQNKELKRRGLLWDLLWELMACGQRKDNPWAVELKKELRTHGIVLTGKKSRRSCISPDIYIFIGLKKIPKAKSK